LITWDSVTPISLSATNILLDDPVLCMSSVTIQIGAINLRVRDPVEDVGHSERFLQGDFQNRQIFLQKLYVI